MRLQIRGVGISLSQEAFNQIQRRLQFTLGRFAPRIDRVSVRVSDTNGPRGGINKRCQISVKTRKHGLIIAESKDANITSAAGQACDRVGRAVVRAIERARLVHGQL